MDFDDYGEPILPDEEAAIEQVLGERPRAKELRLMREALEQRQEVYLRARERAETEKEKADIRSKLTELARQIAAVTEEEQITTFVESSVRVTLHRPADDDQWY